VKTIITFIIVLLCFGYRLNAQARVVYGRVIGDGDLEPVIGVLIENNDHVKLGQTGMDGRFKISVPQNTERLSFRYIGYEPLNITLTGDCDSVEVVMMESGTHDFESSRKIDRERLKQFNALAGLHLQAYHKGVFTKPTACYYTQFVPHKPALDSIQKEMDKETRRVKLIFEKLNVGDTVKIPLSIPYGRKSADTVNLSYYSRDLTYYSRSVSGNKFDCIIKGIIISKNRHRRGFHLVFEVTDCDLHKKTAVFENRVMKIGEVFTCNMGYFKILNE
jgi:hypothetical protein